MPPKNRSLAKEFSLINPLIIKKILNKYSRFEVKIKWPNDLLIKSKKVCGVLQEFIRLDNKNFLIFAKMKALKTKKTTHKYINKLLNYKYIKLIKPK